ncbi:MAG: hypothetical protein ABSF75_13365, partial [Terracidiphilus sp.]
WRELFVIRDVALQTLERAREAKMIGKGLEARIKLSASGTNLLLLRRYEPSLKEIFNVSEVTVVEYSEEDAWVRTADAPRSSFVLGPGTVGGQLPKHKIEALPASGHKCARCWNFMPEVSSYGIWENVCTRCQAALREMGIEPPVAAQAEANQ